MRAAEVLILFGLGLVFVASGIYRIRTPHWRQLPVSTWRRIVSATAAEPPTGWLSKRVWSARFGAPESDRARLHIAIGGFLVVMAIVGIFHN
jgi:hypothetical protein